MTEKTLQFFISRQSKEGWWSEGGPIAVYNYVTAMAVSLYYEWSGDKAAGKSVERALSYHMSTTYSDMRNVETIDGRVRYKGIGPYLPPSFSRYKAGQKFLNDIVKALQEGKTSGIQLFSFLGLTFDYAQDKTTSSKIIKARSCMPEASFAQLRKGDWCITACGYKPEWLKSRFRLDRQNLVSIWHKKCGLIMGGGHSKYQPEMSLFNIFDDSNSVKYIHDKAIVSQKGNKINLQLWYGTVKVGVCINIINSKKLSITYSCNVSDKNFEKQMVKHSMIFCSKPGKGLSGKHARQVLKDKGVYWTGEDHGNMLKHNGWKLTIPELEHTQTRIDWPVHPFNSYRLDAKSYPGSDALVVSSDFHIFNKEVKYVLGVE
ncbi:MAG: hypothetical protein ACYTFY_13905 [Planctomycetota bacterium]